MTSTTAPTMYSPHPVPVARRLDRNEHAFPPGPSVRAALASHAGGVHRYPTGAETRVLTRALASHLDVDEPRILVGAGSAALLQHIVTTTCRDGSTVLGPRSWEAYPGIVSQARARWIEVALTASDEVDLDAVVAAIDDETRLVILANPNNPTGGVVRRTELARFLDRVPEHVPVVIDEAYRDFLDDPTVPDGLEHVGRGNVIVLRTFSKAYGLAGLRVGYAITCTAQARRLRERHLPFAVSTLALRAATAAVGEDQQRQTQIREIRAERTRLRTALINLGFPVRDSQANFVWLPLRDDSARFAAHLRAAGIAVRVWPGDGVRITLGNRADDDAVLAAAALFDH